MAIPLIGEELEQIKKSHGVSLSHWIGGLVHITVQIIYDIQYLTIHFSGYINAPTEPAFLCIGRSMEYFMQHLHEPIIYSRNKNFKTNKIPHQCFFKTGDVEFNKNNEYSNFLQTYCDADNTRDLSDRHFAGRGVITYAKTILIIAWLSSYSFNGGPMG